MYVRESKLVEIFFRVLLCFLGMLGNSALLFYSVPSKHCRTEPYKFLLINLASSNLLTKCMVDIPSILVEAYGSWFLTNSYCKIYMFSASLSITNSVFTTLSMSIFWFQKLVVSRPANCKMFHKSEHRLLTISIALSWFVAIIFSVPLSYYCSVYIIKNNNVESSKQPVQRIFACNDVFPSRLHKYIYEIMYLLIANALPVVAMLAINFRIIMVLARNRKRVTALKCARNNGCLIMNSAQKTSPRFSTNTEDPPAPNGSDQKSEALEGCVEKNLIIKQWLPCASATTAEVGLIALENTYENTAAEVKVVVSDFERGVLLLNPMRKDEQDNEEQRQEPVSIIYDPCALNCNKGIQNSVLYNMEVNHLVVIPESNTLYVHEESGQLMAAHCREPNNIPGYSQEQCFLRGAMGQHPGVIISRKNTVIKTKNDSASTQMRATLSITAVAGVFFIFWVVYMALRIQVNTSGSQQIINMASLIAASYTTVIPYIFIHSMKKCPCT